MVSTVSDKSFEVWINRCEEVMGGKWLKFFLCGRVAWRPLWGLNYTFFKLKCILCYWLHVVKYCGHVQRDGWPPWSNKRCDTFGDVCTVAELEQLPLPIKYACCVWVAYFCFLVMAGPYGSSEVNKTMSSDKCASRLHAHALPGVVWYISGNVTDVWKPLMRLNPFTGLHIHTQTDTPMLMHTSVRITLPLLWSWNLLMLVVVFFFSPNDLHSTPG